jgi:ferredoxin-NADP reductase
MFHYITCFFLRLLRWLFSSNAHILLVKQNVCTDKWILDIDIPTSSQFVTGMYYNIYVNGEKRAYTPIVPSATHTNVLQFYIKSYSFPNALSKQIIHTYKVYDSIIMKGPFGNKSYVNDTLRIGKKIIDTPNLLFISCGTGATPFLSIFNARPSCNSKYNFTWVHVGDDEQNVIPRNLFKEIHFYNRENRLSEQDLRTYRQEHDPHSRTIFVCGPHEFIGMVKQVFDNDTVVEW